jgi:hypothetical protein
MAKHRSFKIDKFFRAVDDALLRDYFIKKQNITVPVEVQFTEGSFNDFWDGLSEDQRALIEEELHCVNDIADRARNYLEQAVRAFDIEKNDDERSETTAMRVFLHSDEAFYTAFDYYLYVVYSEKLSHHKFAEGTADFSGNLERFKTAVEEYFKESGKSRNCAVRYRTDGDKQILLIARGDFMQTHLVFENGKVEIKSFRPAKEDMLVFDTRTSVLSVNISGRSDEDKKKYIEIFGKTIMGLSEVPEETFSNTLVILTPIKNNTFNYGGNVDIESVKLTEVRVKQRGAAPIRLTVGTADVTGTFARYNIDSDGTEFLAAKLKFLIKRDGRKSKQITIEVKPPENTKVPEKREKKLIEDYLREQGVLLA